MVEQSVPQGKTLVPVLPFQFVNLMGSMVKITVTSCSNERHRYRWFLGLIKLIIDKATYMVKMRVTSSGGRWFESNTDYPLVR